MRNESQFLHSAIERVAASGQYILGSELTALEIELGRYIGSPNPAVGVANGTDAIALILESIGIREGDEVITCAFAPVPVITGILMAGAKPVLVDADARSATISVDHVEDRITSKTRAVLAVHLYGNEADIAGIEHAIGSREIHIVEDISQAFGSRFADGSKFGSKGSASALSMYPTKNLGALGDAGAIFVSRDAWSNDLRSRRQYGWDAERVSLFRGRNSRLDELQAAILREKLAVLESMKRQRHEEFRVICDFANELALGRVLTSDSDRIFPHLFVLETLDRPRAIEEISSLGVATSVHYPRALHQHPAFSEFGTNGLTVSERFASSVITIPWEMSSEIERLETSKAVL